jgi:hypothetical protein
MSPTLRRRGADLTVRNSINRPTETNTGLHRMSADTCARVVPSSFAAVCCVTPCALRSLKISAVSLADDGLGGAKATQHIGDKGHYHILIPPGHTGSWGLSAFFFSY